MDSKAFDTDVLVIGSGPMGGATALALATYGIRVHIVTRQRWLANTPRAHITNQRTMEVLRDLGVEKQTLDKAIAWDQMGEMIFTTGLAREEIMRLRTWGSGEERVGDYLQGSPCPLVDISQPYMEPILVENALQRGASASFYTDYLSHKQDDQGVTVQVRDRLSGREYSLRTQYLIGADGARSMVAEQIGLTMAGEMGTAASAYVMFRADLSTLVAHRPGVLYRVITPAASGSQIGMGLLRAIRPWDYWIAGWGYDQKAGEPDLSDRAVKERIRAFVGIPELEPEVESASTWFANRSYATHYSVGRVFCGGDAVHRHPPSSGLGSNTCIQDGFNIAWKLAYVLKGFAAPSLLETYSDERAPVGRQVVERASQSRLDYASLNECLRTPKGPEAFERLLHATLFEASEAGSERRDALAEALLIKNFEFNAQGVELNQRYASKAVIGEPGEEVWRRDPQLYLQATTRPGAKLPHAWLVDRKGRKLSTLDVVGKGQFTLVTGLAGGYWSEAVEQIGRPYLRAVVVGRPDARDVYFTWRKLCEIQESGALLVRPDGYVAWRQPQAALSVQDARVQLEQAIASLLGNLAVEGAERAEACEVAA
jgi:2,4-dichlorophenol 6-monooxygenase